MNTIQNGVQFGEWAISGVKVRKMPEYWILVWLKGTGEQMMNTQGSRPTCGLQDRYIEDMDLLKPAPSPPAQDLECFSRAAFPPPKSFHTENRMAKILGT